MRAHPSPSIPLPVEGRGKPRQTSLYSPATLGRGESLKCAANEVTPSPLNGERAGVRGEKALRHPIPSNALCGHSSWAGLAEDLGRFKISVRAHPSPLIPLPVEGRGKPRQTSRYNPARLGKGEPLECAANGVTPSPLNGERAGVRGEKALSHPIPSIALCGH